MFELRRSFRVGVGVDVRKGVYVGKMSSSLLDQSLCMKWYPGVSANPMAASCFVLIISSRLIRRWFVVAPLARLCAFQIAQLWSWPFRSPQSLLKLCKGVTWVGLMRLDDVICTGHMLLAEHWIHVTCTWTSDVSWLQITPNRPYWFKAPTFTARESASNRSCGETISPAIAVAAIGNLKWKDFVIHTRWELLALVAVLGVATEWRQGSSPCSQLLTVFLEELFGCFSWWWWWRCRRV